MALPELIEVIAASQPARARITVPGSKSITNRALILAALAQSEVELRGALWSDDTQVMVHCLQELGFEVGVYQDPEEICNRTITVRGLGGQIPRAGTAEEPLELYVGNAGTAARFLAAFVCLGQGVYRLTGTPRMHERPQAALFEALRQLGYYVETPNDKLPALIYGSGPNPGSCAVSIQESSQFASALALCARHGRWEIEVVDQNWEESAYVQLTQRMLEVFPFAGGRFQIEPDASSASYFGAANWIMRLQLRDRLEEKFRDKPKGMDYQHAISELYNQTMLIRVADFPQSRWQIDAQFSHYLPFPRQISRRTDLGDSIMTAITIAPLATQPVRFTDLGRLRLQECERVAALRTELTKCGANVIESGDTLDVFPSELHGAEIETYDDHRMAMCFAILGLNVPGIRIINPDCVRKTFPNFFQKLAAPAPRGLGATIWDVNNGRPLELEELVAGDISAPRL